MITDNRTTVPIDPLAQQKLTTLDFSFHHSKKEKEDCFIKPVFPFPEESDLDFTLFVKFIEDGIKKAIPPDLLIELKKPSSAQSLQKTIARLNELLPLVVCSKPQKAPCSICVTLICPSDFTHGVGRYVSDSMSRWLVPGKFLAICSAQSLNFRFTAYDRQNYFVHQVIIEIEEEDELIQINNSFEHLMQEIRINILAVRHARSVISLKNLSTEQKTAIIQDHISSILESPSKDFEPNIFDQMQHFILKLSAEDKISQLKAKFAPFLQKRQKIFDRDIFSEIQHLILLLRDKFTAVREMRHISRVISFTYLFRKSLQQLILKAPGERHLSLKLFQARIHPASGPRVVLGILIGLNVIRENELFEERHIFEAVQHYLPGILLVKDSTVIDRRSHDKVRIHYLEVEKENGDSFRLDEMKELRKKLSRELKSRIENVIHPVFMPRNEEEVMRNILLLSHQLKYVQDIPQVIISFDTQTEQELSFTVILLRLLTSKNTPLKEIFSRSRTQMKFYDEEVKCVGYLRKKYIKEANIFKVKLSKTPFLRKDYSLDLFKARQAVSAELSMILGDIRDFNGGILSKQQEVLTEVRAMVATSEPNNDFLLENFFYSLTPPIMQSLLPPSILKTLFLMFLEAPENEFRQETFLLKSILVQDYFLLMIASPHSSFKDVVFSTVNQMKVSSSDLTFTSIEAYEVSCLGYIYRCENPLQYTLLHDAILESLQNWQKTIKSHFS